MFLVLQWCTHKDSKRERRCGCFRRGWRGRKAHRGLGLVTCPARVSRHGQLTPCHRATPTSCFIAPAFFVCVYLHGGSTAHTLREFIEATSPVLQSFLQTLLLLHQPAQKMGGFVFRVRMGAALQGTACVVCFTNPKSSFSGRFFRFGSCVTWYKLSRKHRIRPTISRGGKSSVILATPLRKRTPYITRLKSYNIHRSRTTNIDHLLFVCHSLSLLLLSLSSRISSFHFLKGVWQNSVACLRGHPTQKKTTKNNTNGYLLCSAKLLLVSKYVHSIFPLRLPALLLCSALSCPSNQPKPEPPFAVRQTGLCSERPTKQSVPREPPVQSATLESIRRRCLRRRHPTHPTPPHPTPPLSRIVII